MTILIISLPFISFAQELTSEQEKEMARIEAQKIVNSRKINKTKEDPAEKVPIVLPEIDENKEREEKLEKLELNIPVLKPFLEQLKDNGLEDVVSLSIDYTLKNLDNHGFGINFEVEKKLSSFLSVYGDISIRTVADTQSDEQCLGWNATLGINGYPFNKGLEWLYFGAYFEGDYFTYNGNNNIYYGKNDFAASIVPSIGWKQFIFKTLMIDLRFSYKFVMGHTDHNEINLKYLDSGPEFSFGYSIMWGRVIRRFIADYILKNPER